MSKDNTGLLVVGGLALIVLGPQLAKLFGGGGHPAHPGGSIAGGSIGSVSLGQDKHPGDLLNVSVQWSPGTKDAKGSPIGWQYQLLFDFYVGGVGGVKLASGTTGSTTAPATGAQQSQASAVVPQSGATGIGVGATYDVVCHVTLQAAQSNADGTPGAGWVTVASGDSNPVTVNQATVATPTASIASIQLSSGRPVMHFLSLRDSGAYIYNSRIGGILSQVIPGVTLAPDYAPPHTPQGLPTPMPNIGWQAQAAASTRPGDQPLAKISGLSSGAPFQSYEQGTGHGVARPSFSGGAQGLNGPGGRWAFGQVTMRTFFQPNYPRGASRGI